MSFRPDYELRDGKIINKEKNENEKRRKEVGNIGERSVRSYLQRLNKNDFFIVSGVEIRIENEVREFDHLVIANDVIFLLETKAFGMKYDVKEANDRATLYIENGDNWRIDKRGRTYDIKSPTKQISAEKEALERIVDDSFIKVIPVVLLSNNLLEVKQNIPLTYDVVLLKDLLEYIKKKNPDFSVTDRRDILRTITEKRIN